jgi:cyclic pyranopterin phosphate synthase
MTGQGTVKDTIGRGLEVLRVSVTDRCNLRCQYCMPAEVYGPDFKFLPRQEVLRFEEIERLLKAFVRLGVRAIKLTGGEPLLRRDLPVLIAKIRRLDEDLDISLTTNGLRLEAQAEALVEGGLDRVNVSMDGLDASLATRIAGREINPEATWRAVLKAKAVGLKPKINAVIQRGLNESEILPLAKRCREAGISLRFIEFMDVGTSNDWNHEAVVTGKEIHDLLHKQWPLQPAGHQPGETARRFAYADGSAEVGFINSITEPFCKGCNRARLSADGSLYTCLFAESGQSLKPWLRDENLDTEAIAGRLASHWGKRSDRYSEIRHDQVDQSDTKRPEMWALGG